MTPESLPEADYSVLGLDPGAKPAAVKQAYRVLVKKWHPDRFHSKPYEDRALAEEKFREINEAYERISRDWGKRSGMKIHVARPAGAAELQVHPERGKWQKLRREIAASQAARGFFFTAVLLAVLVQAWFIFYDREDTEIIPPMSSGESSPESADSALLTPRVDPVPENLVGEPAPAPFAPLLQEPADQPKPFFTIGSSASDVLRIQGQPSRIQGQTWIYGLSEVHFRQGRVWRYDNFDGSLKVVLLPIESDDKALPPHFTLGSTEDEVLLVQGTPTRVEKGKWYYGFAEVRFRDGRVNGYDNYFGTLKVRVLPSYGVIAGAGTRYFTVGSTPDDVLAAQGTPTSIQGNLWSYNFSQVYFRDGRVINVSDSDDILLFVSPEDLPARPAGDSANYSGP